MPAPTFPPGFDFLDPDVCVPGLPVEEFAELRKSEPITGSSSPRSAPAGSTTTATGWSPSTRMSRRCPGAATCSPARERRHPGLADDMTREHIEVQRFVMLNMDAPHHTRLRKIISRGFTPRAIGRLQDELAQRAQNIAKTAAAEGTGDFVEQVSCELPLQAIAGLLGVPQEDRDKLFRWSNEMTGNDDPEYADVDPSRRRWN